MKSYLFVIGIIVFIGFFVKSQTFAETYFIYKDGKLTGEWVDINNGIIYHGNLNKNIWESNNSNDYDKLSNDEMKQIIEQIKKSNTKQP